MQSHRLPHRCHQTFLISPDLCDVTACSLPESDNTQPMRARTHSHAPAPPSSETARPRRLIFFGSRPISGGQRQTDVSPLHALSALNALSSPHLSRSYLRFGCRRSTSACRTAGRGAGEAAAVRPRAAGRWRRADTDSDRCR